MKRLKKYYEFLDSNHSYGIPSTDNIQIKSINVINGPNRWSESRTNLIQMVLDLGEFEQFPSNKIPNFVERLKLLIPSLHEHRCSVGHHGGFFIRLDDGTWIGHIIEHVALELQTLAGMDTGWGRTRGVPGQEGVYNVVFNYTNPLCGEFAAKEATRVIKNIIDNISPNIERTVEKLRKFNLESN